MSSKGRNVEVNSARSRFESTLQHLVDKKDDSPVSDDEGETIDVLTTNEQPLAIPSPSKRVSRAGRKRKRKDEDEMGDGSQYHHTYVMKLFDRSVDLAQFNEDTPLYPVCRAWLKNQPSNRTFGAKDRTPSPEPEPEQEQTEEESGETFPNVYKMPPPIKEDPDCVHDYRIPEPTPQTDAPLDINADQDTAPPPEQLLLAHMDRWKVVRQSWREAGFINEMRFSSSMNLLRDIFDYQMKDYNG